MLGTSTDGLAAGEILGELDECLLAASLVAVRGFLKLLAQRRGANPKAATAPMQGSSEKVGYMGATSAVMSNQIPAPCGSSGLVFLNRKEYLTGIGATLLI